MQYDEILQRVEARAGLPRERAAVVTDVVLRVLAESIDEKEARDLASELPRDLKPALVNVPRHGQRYLAHEFLERVAEREGVSPEEARLHAKAVLGTMREAVSRGEISDVLAELFHDPEYSDLWAPPPPARPVEEPLVGMGRDEFIDHVRRRGDLDEVMAERAIRATLITLGERITRGEADDIAPQLPQEFRPWLLESRADAERFSTDEFMARVAKRMEVPRQAAQRSARAVLTTLREAISDKEVRDMLSQLPEDMRRLFSPVAA